MGMDLLLQQTEVDGECTRVRRENYGDGGDGGGVVRPSGDG